VVPIIGEEGNLDTLGAETRREHADVRRPKRLRGTKLLSRESILPQTAAGVKKRRHALKWRFKRRKVQGCGGITQNALA